jgi:hypothetical protein
VPDKLKSTNWDLSYGHHLLCHPERASASRRIRPLKQRKENGFFDFAAQSAASLRMTEGVATWARRFERSAKLKFEDLIIFVTIHYAQKFTGEYFFFRQRNDSYHLDFSARSDYNEHIKKTVSIVKYRKSCR